jgi:hypothetical protein
MGIDRILRIGFYALIVIFVVFALGFKIWFTDSTASQDTGSSVGLILSYILLGLAALGTLVASVLNIVHNPKTGIKTLVSIVIILAIFGISYAISKGEVNLTYEKYGVETSNYSKLIDAGLYLFYTLITVTVVGIIATEVINMVKGQK